MRLPVIAFLCLALIPLQIVAQEKASKPDSVSVIRKAAERGDVEAQFKLGVMYFGGDGVPQNDAEAFKWCHQAAQQGLAPAQYNLGYMYGEGRGVPKNDAQAAAWYLKAAEQGEELAQYELGRVYAYGIGFQQDYVQAYMWTNLAASNLRNEDIRKRSLSPMSFLETKMTKEQIAEAQRLSSEWKPQRP